MLSPEEYEKKQSKKTAIPIWVFLCVAAFIFFKIFSQTSNSIDEKELFNIKLRNAELIKYGKFENLKDIRTLAPITSGTLSKNQIKCLLSSKKAWTRVPNIDVKQFYINLLFNNETLVLDMTIHNGKTYFHPILIKKHSYEGVNFTAVSKCDSSSGFNEI